MKLSEISVPRTATFNFQADVLRGFPVRGADLKLKSDELSFILNSMGAGDVIPLIKELGLDTILLSILHQKGIVSPDVAEAIFARVYPSSPIEIAPSVAQTMMDAKDAAGAVTGVAGATGDIRFSHDFSHFLTTTFPNIGNVRILSLPGAASLTMLAKIQELGIGKYNTTIVSANGNVGGIWNDPELAGVANGSKINPGNFVFDHRLQLEKATDIVSGSGRSISGYVHGIDKKIDARRLLHAEVISINQLPGEMGYNVVFMDEHGAMYNEEFDIVLFGPGAHIANTFVNSRIQQLDSNGNELKTESFGKDKVQRFTGAGVEIQSHRWQNNPTKMPELMHKLQTHPEAELLIFGFGNSSIEVIQHCMENDIPFKVVSDTPLACFFYPDKEHKVDGGYKQLARKLTPKDFDPQTGIAYDYDVVKKIVAYIVRNGNLISDASKVVWKKYGTQTFAVITKKDGTTQEVQTIDENFCLYGYKPETAPIKELVELNPKGVTATDFAHQAINKTTRHAMPGLFIHGLAAHGRNNAVLPGIGYDVPATVVAALVHSIRLHELDKLRSHSLTDVISTIAGNIKRIHF